MESLSRTGWLAVTGLVLFGAVAPSVSRGQAPTSATAAAPAPAPAAPASAPQPPARAPEGWGFDLARQARWYASADLPADAPAATIMQEATPTSATVKLRRSAGAASATGAAAATLFAVFELPAAPAGRPAAEVTLGDIEGDDEAFVNGVAIGATQGWGVNDGGIPRRYSVPASALRPGQNVLALRLAAWPGSSTFGLRRPPITFAFQAAPAPPAPPSAFGGLPPLEERAARAAIARLDPQNTAPQTILRKAPSFGRFGRFYQDGLPCVGEVSPTTLNQRSGPSVQVMVDRIEATTLAAATTESAGANPAPEPGIDGFHKLARVRAQANGKPLAYTWRQSVLYPGAIAELEQGAALQLHLEPSGAGKSLAVLPLSETDFAAAGLPSGKVAGYCAYEPTAASTPLLVLVAGGQVNVAQAAAGGLELTIARPAEPGGSAGAAPRVFLAYPTGIQRLDLSEAPKDFSDLMTRAYAAVGATAAAPAPADRVRATLALALNEPIAQDEYFQVDEAAGLVRIYQMARYRGAAAGLAAPMAVRPPQLDFAMANLDWPVAELAGSPTVTSTALMAFSGPVRAWAPASPTPDGILACGYALPLPPLKERGLLAIAGEEELKGLLNRHLNDLGSTASRTGVDTFYKSRTQGFQAFSYLSPGNRAHLLANTAEMLPRGLEGGNLYPYIEPLSGLKLWWTYFIEGPYYDRYDQDWGNGLSLYGIYTAIKYTGEWSLAQSHWETIERLWSWFPVTDDWEWLRAANGLHGHGTGAGDCANATYAGALSYAKLARGAGREAECHRGLYAAARAAIHISNRFVYNGFMRRQGLGGRTEMAVGFHEGKGFLAGELNGYPWNVTSNISGNGVQPENFDLYLQRAPEALRAYERAFEAAYPQWARGEFKYPKPSIYKDNSGYITLPHIYLRARTGMQGLADLTELLRGAEKNTFLWWLAPTVVGEVMNTKAKALVTDWGKAAFGGGTVAPLASDNRRQRLDAKFLVRQAPEVVEFQIPRRPANIEVNEALVPLTDSSYTGDKLRLRLRRQGENRVSVVF